MFLAGMGGSTAPEMNLLNCSSTALTARQQLKAVAIEMGQRTWSSAKSFGKIATIYSASECAIEGVALTYVVCRYTYLY